MRHVPFVQTGGLITLIGGSIWVFAVEMRTLALAIVLCWVGVATVYSYATPHPRRMTAKVGFGVTSFGVLSWLGAWFGAHNDVILATHHRLSESGHVIDVINYTVGYLAQRYLASSAYLVFGIGLLLVAPRTSGHQWNVLLRVLGYLSLSLYTSLAWEVYLDAVTSPFIYTTLRFLFAVAWLALGYRLWAGAPQLPTKAYRQLS